MTPVLLEIIRLRQAGRLNGRRVVRLSQELLQSSPDPLHMVTQAIGIAAIMLAWAGCIAATLARVMGDE